MDWDGVYEGILNFIHLFMRIGVIDPSAAKFAGIWSLSYTLPYCSNHEEDVSTYYTNLLFLSDLSE